MNTHAVNRVAGWLIVALCVASILSHLAALARGGETVTLAGIVSRVIDGDTLDLTLASGETRRVRLAEIDAPEKRQPGGLNARAFLEAQSFGKRATVEASGSDRYGRTIGRVKIGNLDLCEQMIRYGWAWQYTRYSDSEKLAELQAEARQKRRGVWAADVEPMPPWEWRRKK